MTASASLALSGGGTKGAFEVGAVQYLSRNEDFLPPIITGTSVGSLIGGPLAQAHTPAEFTRLGHVVQENALAVTRGGDVFGKQPWLDEIGDTPLGQFVDELISVRSRPPVPPDPVGIHDPLLIPDPPRRHRTLFALSTALTHGTKFVKAGRALLEAGNSIMNLDPFEAGYRGIKTDGVREVDERKVAESPIRLLLCLTSMRDGVSRYVTDQGIMVASDANTPYEPGGTPGVIEGMLASSSVPMIFPPRRIGDDIYVDGGILQNTPLEAAVRAGAGDVIAILAGPDTVAQDDTDYTTASLLSVYQRAASEIGPHELGRENLRYPLKNGADLTIIMPTADVLGGFETEAGLIMIDFDYGWLRAAEATSDFDGIELADLHRASDTIALQRERSWLLEDRILSQGPQLNLVGALRRARQHIVAAVTRWRASGLPERRGMHDWGHMWEQHKQPVPEEYRQFALP
ncbi:MAG: patatin-like phospholipase family protein [Actinobacteria bacterium]|nr:patatin-like phospholipase family protein [Actinomycetota bacterium]